MLYLTNCSDLPDDVGRFDGEEEVRAFCARTKIDGFELLALGGGGLGPVPRELVIGCAPFVLSVFRRFLERQ